LRFILSDLRDSKLAPVPPHPLSYSLPPFPVGHLESIPSPSSPSPPSSSPLCSPRPPLAQPHRTRSTEHGTRPPPEAPRRSAHAHARFTLSKTRPDARRQRKHRRRKARARFPRTPQKAMIGAPRSTVVRRRGARGELERRMCVCASPYEDTAAGLEKCNRELRLSMRARIA
jgi:hypothetical protein